MALRAAPPIVFTYVKEKNESAVEYILKMLGGRADEYLVLYVLYLADRYHIRKYHYPLSTEFYVGTRNGPVASHTHAIFRSRETALNFRPAAQRPFVELISQEINISPLTDPERQSLEFALSTFSRYTQDELSRIVKTYPEWRRISGRFRDTKIDRIPMGFADFLDEADSVIKLGDSHYDDPFKPLSKKEKDHIMLNVWPVKTKPYA